MVIICDAHFNVKPRQFECKFLEFKGVLTCQLNNITISPNITDYEFSTSNDITSSDHIKAVLIKNSNIYSIPSSVFEKFNKVEDFHSDSNNLHELTDDSFKSASNLVKIYLDHNNISEIPESTFHYTVKLTRLRLGFNQITHLNDFIFRDLHNLVILALNDNLIQKVTLKLFQDLSSLQFLYLENNKIKTIQDNSLQKNNGLKYLFLRSNECINLDFLKISGVEEFDIVYKKCVDEVVETNVEISVEESENSGWSSIYIAVICMVVSFLIFGAMYFYWPFASFL